MKINYRVHSVSEIDMPFAGEFEGRPIEGWAKGLCVELVTPDEGMSHTLRFIPTTDDLALFVNGAEITGTFEATQAAL